MILAYSGDDFLRRSPKPELVLAEHKPAIMLSYIWMNEGKKVTRFRNHCKRRRRKK